MKLSVRAFARDLVLGLVAGLAAMFGAAGGAEAAPTGLSDAIVRVTADRAAFDAGSPVTVHVTIANPNTEALEVLSWLTPQDGVQGPLFVVTRDGAPVRYLGAVVKRPAPGDGDYLTIAPGGSLDYDVDLSASYSFAESGEYAVSYATGSPDAYSARDGSRTAGSLVSEQVLLEVAGRPDRARKAVTADLVTGTTSFAGCSTMQQNQLLAARSDASVYGAGAIDYFANHRSGARYQKWFGAVQSTRWNSVEIHYLNITSALDTASVTFDCSCSDSSYAYVYPSSPYTIYLCSAFWPAPATGTDSKAGTLIHEMSHFTVVAGTDDFAYGQSAAMSLALSNPANAVLNADSHEYFAENTPATADNAPAITLDAYAHDFGDQGIGTSSAAHPFTLTNTGDATLVLGTLTASGDFALSGDTCSGQNIAPAATCTFDAEFTPTSTGLRSGSVTIPGNAPLAVTPGLTGTGTSSACGDGQTDPGEGCDDGNLDPGDGCSADCAVEPCTAAPRPACVEAALATMLVDEKTAGKERLKLQWKKAAALTTPGAFGDPVGGTTDVSLCLYDDADVLVGTLVVDRGSDLCGGVPCWMAKGTKGYSYKDLAAASDGIAKITFVGGEAGAGKAGVSGANNAAKGLTALPTGLVAALSGNTHPTMQFVTSDGLCLGATMTETTKDDGLQYGARKK